MLYTLYISQNNIVVSMPKIIVRKYGNPFLDQYYCFTGYVILG